MVSRELLDACRSGEPGAFEELVELTHRQVYTVAHRLVGDRHEAEDVAQETFLRVHRSLKGFRGDARFETWLYRITANAALKHMRRQGRFRTLLHEEQEGLERLPAAEGGSETVERDEVREALNELTPGQRTVVVMKDIYGFSCQEIGEQMGISEGAVKVKLHRARRRLKELIYGAPGGKGHEDVHARLPEYAEEGHGPA